MLKRNPEERATLSEILQDSELRKALENPLNGMVIVVQEETKFQVQLLLPSPSYVGHWSDIYEKMT